jgi:hypothetical protein
VFRKIALDRAARPLRIIPSTTKSSSSPLSDAPVRGCHWLNQLVRPLTHRNSLVLTPLLAHSAHERIHKTQSPLAHKSHLNQIKKLQLRHREFCSRSFSPREGMSDNKKRAGLHQNILPAYAQGLCLSVLLCCYSSPFFKTLLHIPHIIKFCPTKLRPDRTWAEGLHMQMAPWTVKEKGVPVALF